MQQPTVYVTVEKMEEMLTSYAEKLTDKDIQSFIYTAFAAVDNAIFLLNLIYRYRPNAFQTMPVVLDNAISFLYNRHTPTSVKVMNWLIEKKAVFSPIVLDGFAERGNVGVYKILVEYLIDIYPTAVIQALKKTLDQGDISFAEYVARKFTTNEKIIIFLVKYVAKKKDIVNLFDALSLDDHKLGLITILAISEANVKLMDKLLKTFGMKYFHGVPDMEWFPLLKFVITNKKINIVKWFVFRKFETRSMSQIELKELDDISKKELKSAGHTLVSSYLKDFCGMKKE